MILVDTSVWIAALRDRDSREGVFLRAMLDDDRVALTTPVRIEVVAGARSHDRSKLRRLLSALPCWTPTESTWDRVEGWIEPAARAGERFGVVDLLIAAMAVEHRSEVWSLDGDFARMERLGWLGCYRGE